MAYMLIDGGKKYNIRKRKKTNKNKRRKRKRRKGQKTERSKVRAEKAAKARARKESQGESQKKAKKPQSASQRYKPKNTNRWTAATFSEDRTKLPLIVFGDGMRNKDNVHFKEHSSGVTGNLYRSLLKRQR
ncbi:hypothetical protein BDF20DRAFT_935546, partial [Mycotypha africana]|uniref:uncharacterized protein n=1 Tax=Mycotypha africana TaxID=64632 RepID=UPI002300A2BD